MMTSKELMLIALRGECPDRLPVTTHHVMPSFLDRHMEGASDPEFFDRFGLDPILEDIAAMKPDAIEAFADEARKSQYLTII